MLIQAYKEDEAHTEFLLREDPHRESDDWGFERRPTRACPVNSFRIEWIYLIDLDLDVFRVSDIDNDDLLNPGAYGTQFFRLDNIPSHLFSCDELDHGVSESLPAEYLATHLDDIPEPDPVLLALHDSLAPPPEATLSLPSGERRSSWHRLQLELISEFVRYFRYSFIDSCPSRVSSPFVFRQMAYAVLCLTSRAGMKFHPTTVKYLLEADEVQELARTPTWEPPDTDTYWLGDVLIVLDEHLSVDTACPYFNASIARAVQLAAATPATAVIFSVNAVILVQITPGEPITHTPALPLFTLDPVAPFSADALARLDSVAYATPGVLALLDLFNTYPRIPRFAPLSPARLPTELCRMVFRAADGTTQDALEASCRLFRSIAGEYPRVDNRTIDKWGPDDGLMVGGRDGWGWQVGLWGTEKLELNMAVVSLGREMSLGWEDLTDDL